ncbi:MAG: SGNH/GDSL hydrolase family protein [Dysgonamonadaceae bacterium]|jgi:lysophospholipase L1-like esterase|nr:SGNH/GDSL hydrolase family protein [Dysgonamonadaceae bacterium]
MKIRIYIGIFALFLSAELYGQRNDEIQFTDASRLTITGKALSTAVVYHRVDTAVYKGLSPSENQQARCAAGLAVLFKTNANRIDLWPVYQWELQKDNRSGIAAAGFSLYIKKENRWVYAQSWAPPVRNEAFTLIHSMDSTDKECMLYLPPFSELSDLKIGIPAGATIEALPNPFKRKIVFFGSSFTQGVGASRPGMSYPMQIGRNRNIEACNLGFGGNSKLQDYFARVIAATDADAFVFDAFSNPTDLIIRERLATFIEIIQKKHNQTPLIFVQTIHREGANFNRTVRTAEDKKRKTVEELMQEMVRKYPNVYWVESPLSESISRDTSTDGVHPSDLGYRYWAKNMEKQLHLILAWEETFYE